MDTAMPRGELIGCMTTSGPGWQHQRSPLSAYPKYVTRYVNIDHRTRDEDSVANEVGLLRGADIPGCELRIRNVAGVIGRNSSGASQVVR